MPDKIFLHLFILCGICAKAITGTFAGGGARELSDILIRQKRVISHVPGEDITFPNRRFPFIVKIKQYRRINCAGSILSQQVVITAALCVITEVPQYYVVSGAARLEKGTVHTVIDIKTHYGNHPNRSTDGIALLTVHPPFVYGTFTNYIQLHSGNLLPGILGTITGWGYNLRSSDPGTCYPKSLRAIRVPIMAHQECKNIYRPHNIEISDKDICTYHPEKHCGHLDGGAPLIVDDFLAGVHLWTGPGRLQNQAGYPEVFLVVQDSEYNQWIRSNI